MRFPKRIPTEWLWLAALLLLVSLHFWFPRLDPGFDADTFAIGGAGKKAFFQLVQQRYGSATRNASPLLSLLPRLDYEATLCVLGPARYPTAGEWNELLKWVARGGSLVFAARYDDPAIEISAIEVEVGGDETEAGEKHNGSNDNQGKNRTKAPLPAVMHKVKSPLSGVEGAGWQSRGQIKPGFRGDVLVESNNSVQAISRRYGDGSIVVVASDFIFSNQSLAWRDHVNSVLAVRLLDSANPVFEVVFDESLNESGTPKIVSILLTPILRPITVQLFIGIVVFGWWRSRRFGPLLPPSAPNRHNIVDHTDALGNLYYRTREGSGVLRSYLRQLVWELRIRHSKGREKRILRPLAVHLGKTVDEVGAEFREAGAIARLKHVERHVAAQHIRSLAVLRRAAVEIGLTRTRDPKMQRKHS